MDTCKALITVLGKSVPQEFPGADFSGGGGHGDDSDGGVNSSGGAGGRRLGDGAVVTAEMVEVMVVEVL